MSKICFNKSNAEQAADRLYRLYSGRMQNEISASLSVPPPPGALPEPPLVEPQPDDDVCRERDPLCWKELPVLLEMFRRGTRDAHENPDDSLHVQVPIFNFENAIETAMLGGKVRFVGTRLHTFGDPVEPLIKDYRSFHWRMPAEDNAWFQRY